MISLTDRNFWKEYPELIFAPGIDVIYKKDKSKNKDKSSQLMWAIHLCENLESKYYNVPNKYELIAEKFLKDPKFKWNAYQDAIELYRDASLTEAERSLTVWNDTMKLRSRSIKEMYQDAFKNQDDTKALLDLDKMLAATPKMFDDYKKIKSEYEADKIKKTGKSISSMSDADEI
tara:strand:+ start:13888 stop:14412 length:525 start_codon:yes stop_codon:yes gene_type:complete